MITVGNPRKRALCRNSGELRKDVNQDEGYSVE